MRSWRALGCGALYPLKANAFKRQHLGVERALGRGAEGLLLAPQLPADFYARFALNTLSLLVMVLALYLPVRRKRDVSFSYLMFGVTIFLLVYVRRSTNVSVGLGFGLFAVFGILRYRTDAISARDLTYLFVVIALAVINAVASFGLGALLLFDAVVVGGTSLVQKLSLARQVERRTVLYERVELIRPQRRAELLRDLEERLGLQVDQVEIGTVDFLRDTVLLQVTYRPQPGAFSSPELPLGAAQEDGDAS